MAIIQNTAAAIVACCLMMGNAPPQSPTQDLLHEICTGGAAAAAEAEQQLESRGAEDLNTRTVLSDRLPSLLSQMKDLRVTILLAQLAGTLKLVSTIPALSELLKHNNKTLDTDLYRSAELLDDPIGAALAHIGEPSVPQVSNLLQASDSGTRSRAVLVLAKIGTPDALNILREASKSEKDRLVRAMMLSSLKQKPPPR